MGRRLLHIFWISLFWALGAQANPSAAAFTPWKWSEVFAWLEKTPSGRKALEQATRHWGLRDPSELTHLLRIGRVSKTDAVLTRYYHPDTGREERERKVTISIRGDQGALEAALDLAHELTHAIHGPAWDPYDPELTAADYIHNAIEGLGGEAQALMQECRVVLELAPRSKTAQSRCGKYLDEGVLSLERVVEDFYRVGPAYGDLKTKLGSLSERFPHLSDEKATLFSSTGRSPYPVALLNEYREITEIACRNSKQRFSSLRRIASATLDPTLRFLAKRCGT
jgi:hypothetical protein